MPAVLPSAGPGAVNTIVAMTQTAAVVNYAIPPEGASTNTPFPPVTNSPEPTATDTPTPTLTYTPTSSATSTSTHTPLPTATSTTALTHTSSPPTNTKTPQPSAPTPTRTQTETSGTTTAYWQPWNQGTVVSLPGANIGTTKYFQVLDGAKAKVIRLNGLKLLDVPNKAAGGSKMVAYDETVTLLGYWNYNNQYDWYFVKIISPDGQLKWVGGDAVVDKNSWVQSCNPSYPDPHCSLEFIPYNP